MCKLTVKAKIERGDYDFGTYISEPGFLSAVKEVENSTERKVIGIKNLYFVGNDDKENILNAVPTDIDAGFALAADESGLYDESDLIQCRPYAVKTLCDRLGISGSVLLKFANTELVDILKKCTEKFEDDKVTIVKVGPRAAAVLSGNYKVIPADEVLVSASKKLKKFGGSFKSGYITIDGLSADYIIDNPDISKAYSEFANLKGAIPSVTVSTSNTGLGAAEIVPKFAFKNRDVIIGAPLKTLHKGSGDIDKVTENFEQIFALFQQSAKNLKKLKGVKIDHPVECFKNVAKRVLLPKKYSLMAADDFEGFVDEDTTAYDIYFGLAEILFYAESDDKPKSYIGMLQEQIARALFLDYSRYDTPTADWNA